ncbi:MAG: ketoacyl-ACP synthase III [Lachnospiraceae bacterium]|nr:ketoacyl-ACP synthase III [Lachnospiraceae bacterium]
MKDSESSNTDLRGKILKTSIIGIGSALPQKIVTNDDLAGFMDTSDEWIRQRTGIVTRHIATSETTSSLIEDAARNALNDAGLKAEDLDLIVIATVSGDYRFPSAACILQAALGNEKAMTFDIVVGCAGCVYGLDIADSFIRSGKVKNALVIGAETISKLTDWTDRSTSVLFGDGAAGFVLSATENDSVGIQGIMARGVGKDGMTLTMKERENMSPWADGEKVWDYLHMDGQAVFKFACRKVPESIKEILDPLGLTADDIDKFFLHQANYRIIETVAKMMKQPLDKFPTNMDHVGNISAASVPCIMDEYNRKGLLKKGERYVLCGFGAGLTYATAVIVWDK